MRVLLQPAIIAGVRTSRILACDHLTSELGLGQYCGVEVPQLFLDFIVFGEQGARAADLKHEPRPVFIAMDEIRTKYES